MAAAHIIPCLFNQFSNDDCSDEGHEAALTWDMLRSWTSIDIDRLTGSNINTPANGIYMTTVELRAFGRFKFYFDKDAFPTTPNKYKVRMLAAGRVLSNGQDSTDVEFRALPGIEPPHPDYLRIYAAFAKVLHLCGAVDLMDRYNQSNQGGTILPIHPTEDFEAQLSAKLAIVAL
ncbi:hypothetical protein DAEQUDRAFT_770143 [Daedalea quercina L-15889]|uniref:Uncharacterized protein n=1 Tax=Daedalea quercina L-15889 TaxID=1314783 RepID=A0A165L4N5_9APHY|nr:hypothetical protein DAEQUDRAFT_770143 [Daedalea quercina L-15889]